MQSEIALGSQRHIIRGYYDAGRLSRLRLRFYSGFDDIPGNGDSLVRDGGGDPFGGGAGRLRQAEVAAVTPDLFDATYYSIDPDYYNAYVQSGQGDARFQGAKAVLGTTPKVAMDLGGRNGTIQNFNIEQQINMALASGFDPQVMNKNFYSLRDWTHVLTGWVPNTGPSYTFSEERFAKCSKAAPQNVEIPGKCVQGGRVGYSIRLISRNYLLFKEWQVGGEGEAPGALENPPSPDF